MSRSNSELQARRLDLQLYALTLCLLLYRLESSPSDIFTIDQVLCHHKCSAYAMEVREAIERISEIHAHMSRGEIYRGYRSWAVAASGVVSLLAAALQPSWTLLTAHAFVGYWVCVAIVAGGVAASEIVTNYLLHDDRFSRATTQRATGQFLPCIAAGGALTGAMIYCNIPAPQNLLPGLWAVLFSLGVFASRPYLPRAIGWVGLWYMGAGTLLLAWAMQPRALSPWHVGGVFGAGQLAAAIVLYWNLERATDEDR